MYADYVTKNWLVSILIGTLCLHLTSCKEKSISIVKNTLSKSFVTLTQNGENISENYFLRFSFTTSEPLFDIAPVRSLYQVRAVFEKKDKILFKDIASGAFLVADTVSNENPKRFSYSAYLFKSFFVNSEGAEDSIPITELDYDSLKLVVVYPMMGAGITYSSEAITYSKKHVNQLVSGEAEEITLSIP